MQEAQKRDSEAAELAAKLEKEKKEMQASANLSRATSIPHFRGVDKNPMSGGKPWSWLILDRGLTTK